MLALPDVPRRLNEIRIASFFIPGLADQTVTFHEGIHRLPGGHSLTVGGPAASPRAYWQLDPTRELRYGSDAAYAEAFRELFTDAVRCRLRSAFPVGAALSGGLDSSSVVCVARALREAGGTGPLVTYTARFPTIPRCDEGSYVSAVEAQGGLAPRHVRADTLDPLGDLERMPPQEDEAFYAPGYYMHRALYRVARAEGRRVFLEGTGGDFVLSHGRRVSPRARPGGTVARPGPRDPPAGRGLRPVRPGGRSDRSPEASRPRRCGGRGGGSATGALPGRR